MARNRRKGMIIKNTGRKAITVKMARRSLRLPPGGQAPITADEVLDEGLRGLLQVRELAIVRPITWAEEREIKRGAKGTASQ